MPDTAPEGQKSRRESGAARERQEAKATEVRRGRERSERPPRTARRANRARASSAQPKRRDKRQGRRSPGASQQTARRRAEGARRSEAEELKPAREAPDGARCSVATPWGRPRRRWRGGAAGAATTGTPEHAEAAPDEHAATRGRPPKAEAQRADRKAGAELGAARAGGPIKGWERRRGSAGAGNGTTATAEKEPPGRRIEGRNSATINYRPGAALYKAGAVACKFVSSRV